jgi:hypothetical protein
VNASSEEVWNRAAMKRGGESPRPGDRALVSLLRVHGRAMNGGVLHAVESDELTAALDAYRFFGLHDAAMVLDEYRRRLEASPSSDELDQLEPEADLRYADVIPDDSTLVEAFERLYASEPNLFAPVD